MSGLYPKDYVGVEVHFPKGNKGSAALKLDAAIFDDPAWVDPYNAYWADYTPSHLEWLNEHLIAVVEFKKEHSNSLRRAASIYPLQFSFHYAGYLP